MLYFSAQRPTKAPQQRSRLGRDDRFGGLRALRLSSAISARPRRGGLLSGSTLVDRTAPERT